MLTNSLTHLLTHSHWCLQPSVTQQWMWLRAWFLHCLTSLCPEMYLFANHRTYNACIMDLPLSSFVFQLLSLTTLDVDSAIARLWLQAVHAFCLYFLYQVKSSFLYCSLFVTMCNGQSIAKNKVLWTTSLLACNWLLGCVFRHKIIIIAYLVPFCLLKWIQ